MIGVYATADAPYQAEAIAASLRAALPWAGAGLVTGDGDRVPDLPFLTTGALPGWDDLLLVAFGPGPLPAALHDLFAPEVAAAQAEGRVCRILPVASLGGPRCPPPPLNQFKAIPFPDPTGPAGQRLAYRIGALLFRWLRGSDYRVFVSYRHQDGLPLANQVSAYLREQGYQAWRDEERLRGGEPVQATIERAVSEADLVLVLDTPEAQDCRWIVDEVDMANRRFVPVFSVVLRAPDADDDAWRRLVYGTGDLASHHIAAPVLEDGSVQTLTEAQLEALLGALEQHLSRLLCSQQELRANVRQVFDEAGFDWLQIDDARRALFACSITEDEIALTRLLAHCAHKAPTFVPAVKALQTFRGDDPGNATAVAFNHRLYIYGPALSRATLRGLARDHHFAEDPFLRLLTVAELKAFLHRYRATA